MANLSPAKISGALPQKTIFMQAAPMIRGWDGQTAFHMAAERGLLKALMRMLEGVGSDCLDSMRDDMGNNPLHLAAGAGCLPAATMLLDAGMKLDQTGEALKCSV